MAHTEKHIEAGMSSQEMFEQMVKDRLRYAVRVALINVLEEEVTAFIGAQPYEKYVKGCVKGKSLLPGLVYFWLLIFKLILHYGDRATTTE